MSPFPPPALGGAAFPRREKLGSKPSKHLQLQVVTAAQGSTGMLQGSSSSDECLVPGNASLLLSNLCWISSESCPGGWFSSSPHLWIQAGSVSAGLHDAHMLAPITEHQIVAQAGKDLEWVHIETMNWGTTSTISSNQSRSGVGARVILSIFQNM